jgi:hypothetical protein
LLEPAIAQHASAALDRSMQEAAIPMGIIRPLDEVFSDPAAQQLVREETIAGKLTKRVTSIAFTIHGNQITAD